MPLGGVFRFKYPQLEIGQERHQSNARTRYFRYSDSTPGVGSAGSGMPVSSFIAPVIRNVSQNRSSYIAIASTGSAASVSLVLRNRNGEAVSGGQTVVSLAPNARAGHSLQELFPDADLNEFEGTITGTAADSAFIIGAVFELGPDPGEYVPEPITVLR